jgi:ArsR family transcriptional regulator, arsenate/arsenite/antimonite-responsive transcriptional repressor
MATATTDRVDTQSCCTPLMTSPLDRTRATELATLLKAVADPTRLQLLSLVAAAGDGAACVCDLTAPLGLRQPTVSHHLKVMVDAGLLTREQRGSWAYYSLVRSRFDDIQSLLALD